MLKLTHTLFYKGLTKKFAPFGHPKTNPKRTQTKPNSKRSKMNANSVLTRYYENKWSLGPKKTKPKRSQFSLRPKMNINSLLAKDYENLPPRRPKKNKPKSNPISMSHISLRTSLAQPWLCIYTLGKIE